jgi:hypothetical protein
MTHLLIWALVVWGMTSILTRGRIFRPVRDRFAPGTFLGDFVRCDQCVGLWVGLGLSLGLGFGAVRMVGVLEKALPLGLSSVMDGVAASAVCAAAGTLTDYVKAMTVKASLGR